MGWLKFAYSFVLGIGLVFFHSFEVGFVEVTCSFVFGFVLGIGLVFFHSFEVGCV